MPTDKSPHRFAVGQRVVPLPDEMDRAVPSGSYVITRTLPGDDFGRSYGARGVSDGVERTFREPQLRAAEFLERS